MILDKSPADFFCFYNATQNTGPYPAILSHLQEGSISSAPHKHPRGYQLPPKDDKIRLSHKPRGGSAPFSREQNAGVPFPEAGHGRHRQQARMPRCIHREAIPAAGRAAGTALSDPGWHQPEAPGMTCRVCRQCRPGRAHAGSEPRSREPPALRPGRGAVEPTLLPRWTGRGRRPGRAGSAVRGGGPVPYRPRFRAGRWELPARRYLPGALRGVRRGWAERGWERARRPRAAAGERRPVIPRAGPRAQRARAAAATRPRWPSGPGGGAWARATQRRGEKERKGGPRQGQRGREGRPFSPWRPRARLCGGSAASRGGPGRPRFPNPPRERRPSSEGSPRVGTASSQDRKVSLPLPPLGGW